MTNPYDVHDTNLSGDIELSDISIGMHQKDVIHIFDEEGNAILLHVDTVDQFIEELVDFTFKTEAASQFVEQLDD